MQKYLERLQLELSNGVVEIKVIPGSKKNLLEFKNDEFIVYIKDVAEKNKANECLVKFISKKLGQNIKISSGKTSRKKRIKFI